MSKDPKKFKQSWFFHVLKFILKSVKRRPTIRNDSGGPVKGPALIVANHSGAAGPMNISIFFPYTFVPWGAHQMKEGYRSRWNYAYHIFYRQKLKYGRVRSFILATLLSVINKFLYVNMRLIPTYQDVRFTRTLRESLRYLKDDYPILVFPEDSNEGYKDVIARFNDGFVVLADYAYTHHNLDLPIYPVYYSKRKSIIVIGEPILYGTLKEQNLKRSDIADLLRLKVNDLYLSLPKKAKRSKKNKKA